ncbi:hypothetical protein [Amycolatopsis sp. NPDC059657]|uniref:hypothetical protein n=1 Tax=Amycolatopsis sp. NPDC059657 TaxID=3346899 RepID=UPI00366E1C06
MSTRLSRRTSGASARVLAAPPDTAPGSRIRSRLVAVLVTVLVGVLGLVVAASATPGTEAAGAGRAPQQPPPLPLPPNPGCVPGTGDPACMLPTGTPRPTVPATPLPPITALPTPAPPGACFPGSIAPECGGLGGTPPTTATVPPPCAGPNCIPQPAPPSPTAPGTAPAPGQPGHGAAECGVFHLDGCVTNAITSFFRGVVEDALNPLLDLLGKTLLTTPEPSSIPSLNGLWTESWHILLAVYVILVLVAGLILMGYETLQTRYTVKEIAPRLVVGFLAGTLSLFVATKGIELANGLARAVMGEGLEPNTAFVALTEMVLSALHDGGLWLIFIGLALAIMIIVLLITFIVRVMLTILLIAAAPIALMWHALPHTEGIAQAWWKAYGGVLAIQIGQSLALVTALRVFFTPGGFTMFGPNLSGLTNLLLCLALMFVLIKIPFWCLAPLRSGRRSLLGSLVRGVIAYKTMGLLGGLGSASGGRRRGRPPGGGIPADPPATRAGQYMLPMKVRRTRNPARTTRRGWDDPARTGTDPQPGPGQLSLFTSDGNTVGPNPRALPPDSVPNALPRDQLGLPITVRRDAERTGRRSLADDLAAGRAAPAPVRQSGLLTSDGRVNRNARPPARLPRALIAPSAGMLPIHLRPTPAHRARHSLADHLASRTHVAPQTGPGLITPSGRVNPAARAHRRPPRDAYTGNRPLASGQYPLPLGVQRQRKPAPPPAQLQPRRPAAGTQLRLPLDLPRRSRKQ